MAQILLATAGKALAGSMFGAKFAFLGQIAGYAIGATIDSAIMSQLRGTQKVQGPRLTDINILASAEGSPIYQIFGRNRVAGQLIWTTRFREVAQSSTTKQKTGGKGMGGSQKVETTNYLYYCSFAVGLCEGAITGLGRIWADGKVLDLNGLTYRLYYGTEAQTADSKITAVEGAANTPAFKGLAYIVFEEFPLERFGNRIPQMTFEVFSQADDSGEAIEDLLRGVVFTPGLGEFVYSTTAIVNASASGVGWSANSSQTVYENKNNSLDKVDVLASLDNLEATCQNLDMVSVIAAWHGDDLRVGTCTLKPKVELTAKTTSPDSWFVSGVNRASAVVVSTDADGPLLGGTPSDKSVYDLITEMNDRGLGVCFYPFIMMDIPSGNTKNDPYSNNAATVGQPTFPWRGRITCSPAAGYTGTVDKTATAATQVSAFVGTCVPGDFGAWNGNTIPYSGPAEWTYRRMILHYAKLCAAAGGVDAFLIGSEMVNLSTVRSAASTYPFVSALITLAAEVSTILGSGCKVSYAANWDEYHSHRPSDGSNDVYFHLDPLWADSNIDFIGIDNYMPLSDWRDTPDHLDRSNFDSIYDVAYLQDNIEGGEYYDWYYLSAANRDSQTRTTIADGGYAKPWVFRNKDIRNWWLNAHYNRPLGVESGSPTSWTAESKPIWFTEFGCPAIDKGTNQPNVFVDPKSSESTAPYYSTSFRDNLIQRQYYEAVLGWYNTVANNPVSTVYADSMVEPTRMFAWNWDARPYPDFPLRTDVWRDFDNYQYGHWLNGRLGACSLSALVERIASNISDVTIDTSDLRGIVLGYMLDNIMSVRDAIEPLSVLYFFDAFESNGVIKFKMRGSNPIQTLDYLDLAVQQESDENPLFELVRGQETDLPREIHMKYTDTDVDYNVGSVTARRLIGQSNRISQNEFAIVLQRDDAQNIADILLIDAWIMRERVAASLPPSTLALDPNDVITLTLNSRSFDFRLDEINFEYSRQFTGLRTDGSIYYKVDGPQTGKKQGTVPIPVNSGIEFMDLPMLTDTVNPWGPWIALYANPWGAYAVYRSPTTSGYVFDVTIPIRPAVGNILYDVDPGPEGRWDNGNVITVKMLTDDILESKEDILVLSGQNTAAIKSDNGDWEIVQWANSELIAENTYELTRLLRAQLGTEDAMNAGLTTDAPFVVIETTEQSNVGPAGFQVEQNWKYGPAVRDIGDDTYSVVQYTPTGVGIRPYSPVDFMVDREADDDLVLSWKRRTRVGGDPWDTVEVPLAEDSEQYELNIYDVTGVTIVRTVTQASTNYTYTAANQTTDHGAPITTIIFEVYQISAVYGKGTGRKETHVT